MSSSLNLKKTPFRQSTTKKTIEKFGLKFVITTVTETRRTWTETAKPVEDGKAIVDWARSDEETVEIDYNEKVEFFDDEHCSGNLVAVVTTADGPILGIVLKEADQVWVMLDPCIVQYNPRAGTLQLMPIFNVVRRLVLSSAAIRSISVPNDLLINAYPGFIIQNRMGKYQLKMPTAAADASSPINSAKPVNVG